MKISSEKKEENRRRIIQAAVDLITEKGVKAATMRAAAAAAGIGEATIYNYFPTKESILFAYYEDALDYAVQALKEIEGFNEYNLREQFQALFESLLEQYLADREFVAETFVSVFFSLTPASRRLRSIQNRFFEILEDMFQAAIEVDEISEQVFTELIYRIIWDFYIGVVVYWLKDDSDQFTNTSIFIDKNLDLGYALLKSGAINKAVDIASFLFKTHVLNRMEDFHKNLDVLGRLKREFMRDDKKR